MKTILLIVILAFLISVLGSIRFKLASDADYKPAFRSGVFYHAEIDNLDEPMRDLIRQALNPSEADFEQRLALFQQIDQQVSPLIVNVFSKRAESLSQAFIQLITLGSLVEERDCRAEWCIEPLDASLYDAGVAAPSMNHSLLPDELWNRILRAALLDARIHPIILSRVSKFCRHFCLLGRLLHSEPAEVLIPYMAWTGFASNDPSETFWHMSILDGGTIFGPLTVKERLVAFKVMGNPVDSFLERFENIILKRIGLKRPIPDLLLDAVLGEPLPKVPTIRTNLLYFFTAMGYEYTQATVPLTLKLIRLYCAKLNAALELPSDEAMLTEWEEALGVLEGMQESRVLQ